MCLNGEICASPLCRHRMAGTGGVGRPKSKPSTPGRDSRERAYAASHPRCECGGCGACLQLLGRQSPCLAASSEIHHIGGRGLGGWKRKTAQLQALCGGCHGALAGTHSTAAR